MPQLNTRLKELARIGDPSRLFTVRMFPPPEEELFTLGSEYRYVFRGPPKQMNDGLIRMVIRTICELNRTNMLFSAASLWPHNMDETPPIWPGHAGGARKLYAFTQRFEEFPITTEISIVPGTTELTANDILIQKKRKGEGANRDPWNPLKK